MNFIEQRAVMISMTPDPIALIERCGRICYKSEDKMQCTHNINESCPKCTKRSETFINKLLKLGHESVLEHASATFHIVTDRGISHELVRHRLCAYSQESTRYCKYNDISVIEPDLPDEMKPHFIDAMRYAEIIYAQMIDSKVISDSGVIFYH